MHTKPNTKNPGANACRDTSTDIPQSVEALRAALTHAERHAARCDVGAFEALNKWSDCENDLSRRDGASGGRVELTDRKWAIYAGERDSAARAHAVVRDIAERLGEQVKAEAEDLRLMRAASERDRLAAAACGRLTMLETDPAEVARVAAGGEDSPAVVVARAAYQVARDESKEAQKKLRAARGQLWTSDVPAALARPQAGPTMETLKALAADARRCLEIAIETKQGEVAIECARRVYLERAQAVHDATAAVRPDDSRMCVVHLTALQVNRLLDIVGERADQLHATAAALSSGSATGRPVTPERLATLTASRDLWEKVEIQLKAAEAAELFRYSADLRDDRKTIAGALKLQETLRARVTELREQFTISPQVREALGVVHELSRDTAGTLRNLSCSPVEDAPEAAT